MLFQITSTKSTYFDTLCLLPEPEPGMVADIVGGNSVYGEQVRVTDGQWCRGGGPSGVPEHWLM